MWIVKRYSFRLDDGHSISVTICIQDKITNFNEHHLSFFLSKPQPSVVARTAKEHRKRSKESSLQNQKRRARTEATQLFASMNSKSDRPSCDFCKTGTVAITSSAKRKGILSTKIVFELSKQNIQNMFNNRVSTSMCINVNQSVHGLVGNLCQEHYCMHVVLWNELSSKAFIQWPPVNQLMFSINLIGPNGEIDKATWMILTYGEVVLHLIAKDGTVVKLKLNVL